MNDVKGFLIGPFGLAIAVLTVVAFVAAMLVHSLVPTAQGAAVEGAPMPSRAPRGMSILRRVARARWPLTVLLALTIAYRIYVLS